MKRLLGGAALVGAVLLAAPVTAYAQPPATPHLAGVDPWAEVKAPFLLPSAAVRDIDAQSADSIWIGGYQGYFCVPLVAGCLFESMGAPVVRQRSGSGWKQYPLLGQSGGHSIETVAAGTDEVWVLGVSSGVSDYLARFNGSAFLPVARPTEDNVAVLRTGPAGTWVVSLSLDGERLYRRTGSAWTRTPLPAGLDVISDVQALSATDAWAVGYGSRPGTVGPVQTMAHWDGVSWQALPSPAAEPVTNGYFRQVAPVTADDVWVMATDSLWHWNGTGWQKISAPENGYQFHDMALGQDGVPWVVGEIGFRGGQPIYRYTADGWERSEGISFLRDPHLAVAPGTNTIWASGNDGSSPDTTKKSADPHIAVLRR